MRHHAIKMATIPVVLLAALLISPLLLAEDAKSEPPSPEKASSSSYETQARYRKRIYHKNSLEQGSILLRQAREVTDEGEAEHGLSLYRQYVILYPDHPEVIDAWMEIGLLLKGLKRDREAIAAFLEVYRLDFGGEKGGKAYLNAGRILLEEGEYIRAQSILKEVIERYPSSSLSREAQIELKSMEQFPLSTDSLDSALPADRYSESGGSSKGEEMKPPVFRSEGKQ